MQDKEMVNDVLSQINSSLTGYASVMAQSSNPQLRQTIQQIRNSCETFSIICTSSLSKRILSRCTQADQTNLTS